MIDFHSHILPKLDDGSKSSDMSVKMLEMSALHGITTIVATPHFYIRHNDVVSFLNHREASYHALMHKLRGTEKNVPQIRLGAEVYFFSSLSALPEIDKLCIENTSYLLLEMPFEKWTSKMLGEVEKLVYDRRITPIIAHLDRYLTWQRGSSAVEELLSMGAVIQLNGDYINGFLTRNKALNLIKSGIVSLIGSDCHNMDNRAPNLDKAFAIIRNKCGQDALDRIDRCGREILGL